MIAQFLKKIFSVLLLGALLVSCGSNSADNSAAKAGTHLQIRMHDFPIQDEEVEKVVVEIGKIEVHNSQTGWMTVSETSRKYDLLELQGGLTAIVLDSPLPVGVYTQIRLELSRNNQIVVNGLPYPLKVPSGAESGIKLITPFEIREGKMVEVTLDFDAEKSVNLAKGQGYHLKPVIQVERIAEYDGAGLVTPEGGNVTTLDGVLNIQVPAGAVSESIIVTAEKADITALPAPDGSQSVGIAYDLGPDGQVFNSPVVLSFHYNEEELAGKGTEEDLVLYAYDETAGTWVEIPSRVLAAEDTVQAWVSHFSVYVVVISPPRVSVSGQFDIIGDSIAAGYASDAMWPGWLAYFMKRTAPNITFTGNQYARFFNLYTDAIPGSTSGDIKRRLEDPATPAGDQIKDADNYILWVGTNDSIWDPLSTYEQNMSDIITKLLERTKADGLPPTVYVCTILGRTDNWFLDYFIIQRNESLKRIVKAFADQGKPVKLIDTSFRFAFFYYYYYTQFGEGVANMMLLADKLHPTVYGHAIVGRYIAQNLN